MSLASAPTRRCLASAGRGLPPRTGIGMGGANDRHDYQKTARLAALAGCTISPSPALGIVNRFAATLRTSQYRTNVVRSFAAKSFKRIWPPVMMGVFVVLEVAWIIFLVRVFVRFVLPGGR